MECMTSNDWRITNQGNYLYGKELIHTEYHVIDGDWDHDHCEFCWDKFIEGVTGYCTLDKYHWICEKCFNDFKDEFAWRQQT